MFDKISGVAFSERKLMLLALILIGVAIVLFWLNLGFQITI